MYDDSDSGNRTGFDDELFDSADADAATDVFDEELFNNDGFQEETPSIRQSDLDNSTPVKRQLAKRKPEIFSDSDDSPVVYLYYIQTKFLFLIGVEIIIIFYSNLLIFRNPTQKKRKYM